MSEVSMLDRLLEDKKRGARIAYICDHNTQYRMLSLDGIIDALTLATNDALRAENTALRAAVERVRAACENELRWIDAQPILRALEETP